MITRCFPRARPIRRSASGFALGLLLTVVLLISGGYAVAHGVDEATRAFLVGATGYLPGPFMYIGAKHMLTGYDHLLFLFGVIFLLGRVRDVVVYVTLFTLGHSTTLLLGTLANIPANAYLVDAVIGLSVLYKGFDNLQGFSALGLPRPNPRVMVLAFGLVHGLGLATKLQEFALQEAFLAGNLAAFNIGVEIGQLLALSLMLLLLGLLRRYRAFDTGAFAINTGLMTAGAMLVVYQLTGYLLTS